MILRTIDIIEQADKFLDVALYSIGPDYNDGFYVGKIISDDELMKKLFPKEAVTAIVNSAFSCELYLKSMLNDGIIIRNHELMYLFGKIDDRFKKVIMQLMKYKNTETFEHFLNKISDAFEKWRYIYEKENEEKKIYFAFLKDLVITLKKVSYGKYYYEQNCIEKIDEEILEILNCKMIK